MTQCIKPDKVRREPAPGGQYPAPPRHGGGV